jgi:transposase-like protein
VGKEAHLIPKKKRERDVETRQGVKATLDEVLHEETSKRLEAGYRELTPKRKGERNGHYIENLLTLASIVSGLFKL